MRIIAIDPGPTVSAYVVLNDLHVEAAVRCDNDTALTALVLAADGYDALVIEQIESYGMAVGREVFETVFWSGRFWQAAEGLTKCVRLPRRAVKLHHCGSARAKDTNIRQALIDRYGGSRKAAIGVKASPGPLYGVKNDCWQALALGIAWMET